MVRGLIKSIRKKLINKKYLEDNNTRKKYLLKILTILDIDDFVPKDKTKYLEIDTIFPNIKEYNSFMIDNFLEYDLTKPLPKSLFNRPIKTIYYVDFFKYKNKLVDIETELNLFIYTYKELVELSTYFSINEYGVLFLNFKILNFYLSNMEEILIKIISSTINWL